MLSLKPMFAALKVAAVTGGLSSVAIMTGVLAAAADPTKVADANARTVQVTAELDRSVVSTDGGKVYLHIGLEAIRSEGAIDRTPVNVALVLDQSGSMRGDRLRAAKVAAEEALARLAADDRVAIVAYNHKVDVIRPTGRVGSFRSLQRAIDTLRATGRTALYSGVVEGGEQVLQSYSERRVNRVILMSDGLANVGPSRPHQLSKLGQELGGQGISVTTIGLGLNYNEDLMQRLALASDGNHAFAETSEDLAGIFNSEFGDTLSIAAQDIEIRIECLAGYKPIRVLGREGTIDGNAIKLRMSQLTGGAERYLIVELEAEDGETGEPENVARVEVDYFDLAQAKRSSAADTVSAKRSQDAKIIDASANDEIIAKVAEQKANLVNEEAVRLRDKGDVEGARALLNQNASELQSLGAHFAFTGETAERLDSIRAKNKAAAKQLSEKDWAKTRKSLRYEQHKTKRQQTY